MTRVYSWRRGRTHTATFESLNSIVLDEQSENYTLMKTRFNIKFVDETGYSFSNILQNPSTYGIILLPTADTPDAPSLGTSDSWIWWEGITTLPYPEPLTSPPYLKSIGPVPYDIRTSDSHRIVPAGGGRIWLTWDFLDPYSPPLNTQYFAVDMWWEFLWLSPGP